MSIDFIKSLYFELLSYFKVEKRKYKIEGHCNQCGKCCKEIHSYGMKSERDLKIMQFIFPWYDMFYILRTDSDGSLVLSCKNLNFDGKCKIYKFRPLLCRNYPKKYIDFNGEMPYGCGYKVEKRHFKDYL